MDTQLHTTPHETNKRGKLRQQPRLLPVLAVLSKAPDALSLNRAAGNEPIGTGKEPAQYA